METVTIFRNAGNIIIEMPAEADVMEVIREHEITKFKGFIIKNNTDEQENTGVCLSGEAAPATP